jgi:2-keto-3-deoxy-L-rhamnonate aldolase RhmA
VERNNRDSLLVVNIESTPALECLDEILAVPGVDVALIGPHDLSCSLGIPEQYDDPRFDNAVRLIIDRARAHGVAAGIHWWGDLVVLQSWIEAGLSFVIYSADILALSAHIGAGVAILRGRHAGAGEAVDATSPI